MGLGQIKNYPCMLHIIKFAEAPKVQSLPILDNVGGLISAEITFSFSLSSLALPSWVFF